MNTKNVITRAAAGALGCALFIGGASAAVAAEFGSDEVDINVDIQALPPEGALTMSVSADSATLTEVTSQNEDVRQFNGVLPTVTVKDDREEVPAGVAWYITGQSSALTSGADSISAGHLGWNPHLLTTEGDGEVAEGAQVDTVLDAGPNNVGLVGEEFLALSLGSEESAEVGTWTANADLFLKTPVDVAPGAYSGTITLTLWEE